ncbi:MAG: hypothetical protein ACOC14_02690 [Bacillota bacterium]
MMKKLVALVAALVASLTLAGCDMVEDEIERAESIELEDFNVNIPDQSVMLKITSDADEQIIEEVSINGERYDLESQGDDWYLLEDVPIEKEYVIDDLYYRTEVGANLTFDVDYELSLGEAIDRAPEDLLTELDGTLTLGDYRFEESDETLAEIDSDNDYETEDLSDWAFVVLEDDVPRYAVFEHEDKTYVIEAPDDTEEYIE